MSGQVSLISTPTPMPTPNVEKSTSDPGADVENTVKVYKDACKRSGVRENKNFINQIRNGKREIVLTTSADVLSPADLLAIVGAIKTVASVDCLSIRMARKSMLEKNEGLDALEEMLGKREGFKSLIIIARGSVSSDAELAEDEKYITTDVSNKIKDFANEINDQRRWQYHLKEISVTEETVLDFAAYDPRSFGIK